MRITGRDVRVLLTLAVLAGLALVALRLSGTSLGEGRDRWLAPPQPETATVRVMLLLDGDTIEVEGSVPQDAAIGTHRIRLMNIDAPETGYRTGDAPQCLALAARDHLAALLPASVSVRLELGRESTDPYGRWVAAVWRGDELVNARMARAGLVVPMSVGPNDLVEEEVIAAAEEAKRDRIGLFDPQACPTDR